MEVSKSYYRARDLNSHSSLIKISMGILFITIIARVVNASQERL
tara:strand:+ start:405 stop:536 length:132 start_codon:yes stop_codon:yes gene_type:complete